MVVMVFLKSVRGVARSQASTLLNNCAQYKNGLTYLHTSSACRYVLQRIKGFSEQGLASRVKAANVPKRNCSNDFILGKDVTRNVLLYENQNQRSYHFLIATGVVQQIGWGTMAYNLCTPGLWTEWKQRSSLKDFIDKNVFRLSFIGWTAVIGPLILSVIWVLCTRSVKYLILHKGGKQLTVVTFHPLKHKSKMCVDVGAVKSRIARANVKAYMPLKIKGRSLYYLVDGKGQFFHHTLFDNTFNVHA